MSEVEQSVKNFLESEDIPKNATMLLACSGGIDSMVLASILLKSGYQPALAHCNFRLRGNYSGKDEDFVREFAKSYKLDFYSRGFNTKEYAEEKGISTQMAARELRYAFFDELMESENFQYLVLGHHADDGLETILMNLGRGSGLTALAGIQPQRDKILRPLWLLPKHEITQYAIQNKIKWREDLSNTADDYQRNFIRLHLLPPLKEAFPEFESSFGTTLKQTRSDRQLMEHLVEEKLQTIVKEEGDSLRLSLKSIKSKPALRGLIYHWLKQYGSFDIEAISIAIDRGEPGKTFENANYRLLLDRDSLILKPRKDAGQDEIFIDEHMRQVTKPIHLEMEQTTAEGFDIPGNKKSAALDYHKLQFPLVLRKWQSGDSFVPLGMKGRKKLSDFFTDEKIDRFAKEDLWLLCSGQDICWIVGHRIDDRFKITDKSKSVYFVRVK